MSGQITACAVAVVMTWALAACSGAGGSSPKPLPGKHVTRTEFNSGPSTNIWPLKVDEGTLSCLKVGTRTDGEPSLAVVFTTKDGSQYALNGVAFKTGRYHDLRGILAQGQIQPWADATNLILAGLALCPEYVPGRW
jgi:hypothetical protein